MCSFDNGLKAAHSFTFFIDTFLRFVSFKFERLYGACSFDWHCRNLFTGQVPHKKIMKKILLYSVSALFFLAASAFAVVNTGAHTVVDHAVVAPADSATWVVDKAHSRIKFSVSHLLVSQVEGSFRLFEGSMESAREDFSDARIVFTIDAASIDTENEMRDNHLKNDDFFNTEKYPSIRFESTSFQPIGGNQYQLTGNLTIRDVTRPVTFDVTYGGAAATSSGTRLGFKAKTTINRFDYNIKFNRLTETGGLMVGKEVDIVVNVELKKD